MRLKRRHWALHRVILACQWEPEVSCASYLQIGMFSWPPIFVAQRSLPLPSLADQQWQLRVPAIFRPPRAQLSAALSLTPPKGWQTMSSYEICTEKKGGGLVNILTHSFLVWIFWNRSIKNCLYNLIFKSVSSQVNSLLFMRTKVLGYYQTLISPTFKIRWNICWVN